MNSKIVPSTKISSIILAIVLVAGTITSIIFSSSSFITGIDITAQAERDYDGHDNKDDDRKSYGKDNNNNIYKSKKSSKSVDVNKINCNNINININGGQGTNNGNDGNGENSRDSDDGNKTNNGLKKFNKDGFAFVCINNNNNRQITPTPPPPPAINNNVYVVWIDNTDNTPGINEIFFAVSNDNGQTFSTPKNISKTLENSNNPQITSEGDNVYVVWEEGPFNNRDIFFTASTDGGKTFSTPKNLSDSNDEDSGNPQISIEGDNVYVVWEEGSLGDRDIFFAVSNDNGQNFSTPPDNISENDEDSENPQISSEGDNVYVVWRDVDNVGDAVISFAASEDNGENFTSPPENISGDGRSFDPQISSEGDNVYLAWATSIESVGHDDIFFTVSNDNGQTFDTPENISENIEQSGIPQISSEGDNVYVVWQDGTDLGDVFISFAVSNDNGENVSTPPKTLSSVDGTSERPKISSEGDNVYVVWQGNAEIFFVVSNDNGQNFSTPPDNISENTGGSFGPQISTEGDNVYVVWTDGTFGNSEIFFAMSKDNGQNFSTLPDNISENDGASVGPQISSSIS